MAAMFIGGSYLMRGQAPEPDEPDFYFGGLGLIFGLFCTAVWVVERMARSR